MIYSNEMIDQEGYLSPYPSAPPANLTGHSVPPPRPTNPPVIYEMPIYTTESFKYPCDTPLKPEVVTTQPTTMAPTQPACKDYLAWSIVNLFFCNIIFGIVATVFSCKTRDSVKSGDSVSAASNSRKSLIFNVTALVLGIVLHVAWIAVVISQSTHHVVSASFVDNSNIQNSLTLIVHNEDPFSNI